ncbi:hypothetical protein N7463_007760 [Penicillium fimorum]|uniref:Uncharacterized protein n=1 Tax=Penicillium fimorum TaxID=1882269 RepID=A0A9W9XY84_9EURO|nr:hypothetical protein N7463_007760 [Penicillium fimorum]
MSSAYNPQLFMPGFNQNVMETWRHGFPNALERQELENSDGGMSHLVTHREVLMMRVMNTITEKPQWDQKVFHKDITAKWGDKIVQSGQDVTPNMMDWIIKELQFKSHILQATGYVCVFDVGVIKSDTAVSKDIQQALKEAVKPLEDMPEKDYHPGSDGKMVDLVHPSLFPVINGQTRVLPDRVIDLDGCLGSMGQGDIIPIPSSKDCVLDSQEYYNHQFMFSDFSNKFQWLPCDVELIDNAHPVHHKSLYEVVEKIIARAISLWSRSLPTTYPRRIEYNMVEYDEHPDPEPVPSDYDSDFDEDDFHEVHDEWQRAHPIIRPEPDNFQPQQEWHSTDLQMQFPNMKLQIIVKLANIELSPEKPNYEGGSWHIEGQLNERICATAIYHYDSQNITDNSLAFRQRGMMNMDEIDNEYGRFEFLHAVFGFGEDVEGLGSNRDITQNLGAVLCKEGRLLTFPSTVQHRVSPFSLVDPSKPGHRKILTPFLVDPHRRIISSANMPPQREDWGYERQNAVEQALADLPLELQNIVRGDLEPLMTMKKAKEYRLELMEERGLRSGKHNEYFDEGEFSLCEH